MFMLQLSRRPEFFACDKHAFFCFSFFNFHSTAELVSFKVNIFPFFCNRAKLIILLHFFDQEMTLTESLKFTLFYLYPNFIIIIIKLYLRLFLRKKKYFHIIRNIIFKEKIKLIKCFC